MSVPLKATLYDMRPEVPIRPISEASPSFRLRDSRGLAQAPGLVEASLALLQREVCPATRPSVSWVWSESA